MDDFFQKPSRKKFYVIVTVLILGILSIILLSALNQASNQAKSVTGDASGDCPPDYCLQWVYGSCSAPKERYKERTCFDYPESGECEGDKRLYYEKASEPDSSC